MSCWGDSLQQVYTITIHQNCLKVDLMVLYYKARVIMIGTYWCGMIGYIATTSKENVTEISWAHPAGLVTHFLAVYGEALRF